MLPHADSNCDHAVIFCVRPVPTAILHPDGSCLALMGTKVMVTVLLWAGLTGTFLVVPHSWVEGKSPRGPFLW